MQKTSLMDYPDKISAVVWTVGCNFRCPFCYNPKIVTGDIDVIKEEKIFSFLEHRKNLLEAVTVTGGEPLLHKDIKNFLSKIKKMGYLIKIDTNGTFPGVLDDLLQKKLIDYGAMDIKAPKDKYELLVGKKVDIDKISKSVNILKKSSIGYEFRTTVVPSLLKKEDIIEIAEWLKDSKRYYLQQFKSNSPMLSLDLSNTEPYSVDYLRNIIDNIKDNFEECSLRGN
ncbi:MAG: anaerobic ribonucleoside-triphosphate reductase activating protein [Candidatus Thermoplasmatota archaeon]